MQDNAPTQTPKRSSGFIKFLLIAIVFMALGVGVSGYVVMMKPEFLGLTKSQSQSQAEVDSLIVEVGKLIALPDDEKPTVATITDIEKLKEQLFFKNAMNGDRVLIYTNAKKAILYRPSEKKVLEVGAVNIRQQESPIPSPIVPVVTPSAQPLGQ